MKSLSADAWLLVAAWFLIAVGVATIALIFAG